MPAPKDFPLSQADEALMDLAQQFRVQIDFHGRRLADKAYRIATILGPLNPAEESDEPADL